MMLDALVILVLILANGFFAFSEICLVASRRTRLAALARKKVPGARSALAVAEQPEQFLSAVQIGITLVGIVAGAYGGAAFAVKFEGLFTGLPVLGEYSLTVSYVLIVALLTFLSVVIGELVPKRLALRNPERFACVIAPPMKFIVEINKPMIWLLTKSSSLILLLFGKDGPPRSIMTEEEILLVMDEATQSGAIEHEEQQVAVRALRFADRPVTSMMTARADVVCLNRNAARNELIEKLMTAGHSYLPLCGESADQIIGIIHQREATRFHLQHKFSEDDQERGKQLQALAHAPVLIPESSTGSEALEIMRREKTHFAVVTAVNGGTAGVLTNHDVLESLVGFVAGDKHDEEPMVRRGDGTLLVSGWVTAGEVYAAHNVLCEREFASMPIAELLMHRLNPGRDQNLPKVGDKLEEHGLLFEIVDKDGARIDRVLVMRLREDESH